MNQSVHEVFAGKEGSMRIRVIAGLAVSLLAASVLTAAAAEFTADVLIKEGQTETNGKIYVKDTKYRLELGRGQEAVVVLVDLKAEQTTVFVDAKKMYMTIPNSSGRSRMNNPFESARQLRRRATEKKAGEESVNGVPCRKIILVMEGQEIMSIWESEKYGFPMRVQSPGGDGRLAELKNVREEPVSDGLFRIPEGYTLYEEPKREQPRKPAKLPAIETSESASLPIGRRIAGGGELRVKVDPQDGIKLTVVNEQAEESICRATPMRQGKAAATAALTLKVAAKGSSAERTISPDVRADELVLTVEKGLVKALVERDSPPFEKVKKDAMFFMGQGRGMLVKADQPLWLKLEGDNQDQDTSEVKVVFYRGDYADPLSSEEITLANGKSKEWSFTAADRVRTVLVEVKLGGGVKAWLDQSARK
jgi:hypothetical protein